MIRPLRTLYSKLSVALVILLFLVGLFYALLSQTLLKESQQSGNQQLNRELANDLAREMKLVKNGIVDRATMHDVFHMSMLLNPAIEVYYLDLQGTIVDFSAEPQQIKRTSIDLGPIHEFIAGDSMYPLVADDPRNELQQKSFSVAALPDTQSPQGYLYVVLQSSKLDAAYEREQIGGLQKLSLWALLGSLAMGFPIGLLLFHFLTRRIRILDNSVRRFRESGYKNHEAQSELLPEKAEHGDEISQLSHHFRIMSDHIREQYTAIEMQDRQRRVMIANVSHDLRTPLSAVHGYIERLHTRYESLTDIERKAYLATAMRNSQKLGRQIDDLFELSKLEAQEVEPCHEPFSISELAQDIVQKFHIRAESKNIALHLKANNPLPRVRGDIALLDRALSNLVDNAIDHTLSGGHITLRLKVIKNRISVMVEDSGKGIPAEHIDAIFQRFYQADPDDNTHKKHAGLGLAITQRILELHKQTIRVKSEPESGTVFQFFMPIWENLSTRNSNVSSIHR